MLSYIYIYLVVGKYELNILIPFSYPSTFPSSYNNAEYTELPITH